MPQEPNNTGGSAGFGSDSSSALALFRRLSSQTVASSFQTQVSDQFGYLVYNRSNVQIASLSTPIGANATASGNRSTAVGGFSVAREDSSTAISIYSQALGPSSIAIGDQSRALSYRSIAIGTVTTASGVRAIAIGSNTLSSGTDSISVGTTTSASSQSVAIGTGASALGGQGSIAIGLNASSTGLNGPIAIGTSTSATGPGSIAFGNRAVATATTGFTDCIAIGQDSVATGSHAIAMGELARSTHVSSVAIGTAVSTSVNHQFIIGSAAQQINFYSGGHVFLFNEGRGLFFKEQTAVSTSATYGRVTLSATGTAIIYSTRISATSQIMLTPQNASGTAGSVSITTSTAGVKATVGSTSIADTRTVAWLLLESA